MQLYTEITPNPSTLKFVSDQLFLASGTADFPTAAVAEQGSALAHKLFQYPFIQGVFIGRNFITTTKTDAARWEDVIPVVKDEIKRFVASGEPMVHGQEAVVAEQTVQDDSVESRIRQLIEDQVRPAVAMDGGDIVFESFDEGIVKLQLRGSCSGCPSSMVTLKHGIENLLIRMVPEVKAVEAV